MKKASIVLLQLFCLVLFLSFAASAQATNCTYTLSHNNNNTYYTAGNGSISVTTQPGCTWQAATSDGWINITSGQNGLGNGTVNYSYGENAGANRSGSITIASQSVSISQPASCNFNLNRGPFTVPAAQSSPSLPILPNSSLCSYKFIRSQVPWVDFAGNEIVVAANTGPARTGTFDIEVTSGSPFSNTGSHFIAVITIIQESGCTYTYTRTPENTAVSPGGQTITVSAVTQPGCVWKMSFNAISLRPIVYELPDGDTFTGTGSLRIVVLGNSGSSRHINVFLTGGYAFEITQGRFCGASVPTELLFPASGGVRTLSVIVDSLCQATLTSNNSWIKLLPGYTGPGMYNRQFEVEPNTGQARTGTITVASTDFLSPGSPVFTRTITIIQEAGTCSYSLSAASTIATTSGGTGSFNITTGIGCTWNAVSSAGWITTTAAGSGNGAVSYTVAPNTGQAREGTITVGGQTFTVYQEGTAAQPTLIAAGGRVIDRDFKSVRGALVTFTNINTGESQTVLTNPFGYFRQKDVQLNQRYNVTIKHKRYKFTGFYAVTYASSVLSVIFMADTEQQ